MNAAAIRRWSSWRRVCWIPLLILSGCITVPDALRRQVSPQGAHATAATPLGPMTWIRSASYLPGRTAPGSGARHVHACATSVVSTTLAWSDAIRIEPADLERLCVSIDAAAAYSIRFSAERPRLRYSIELVAPDTSRLLRTSSWHPGGPRIGFALRWVDAATSLRDIVDTIAHETLHVVAGIDRLPASARRGEDEAYLAGACAQLAVLGRIEAADVTFGPLDVEDGVPAEALASSAAGNAFYARLARQLAQGAILEDTTQGSDFLQQCDRTLSAFMRQR